MSRLIRTYAPRSIRTIESRFPLPDLETLLPLRHKQSNADVIITPTPLAKNSDRPRLLILVSRNRVEEKLARSLADNKTGYYICETFHIGFFLLPFLWLRFFPGGAAVLNHIFALEVRLHPYLNLLAGVATLTVLEKRHGDKPNSSPRPPAITCVIPAYNEAERLPQYLARIRSYFQHRRIRNEIIVVDDGSRDNTALTIKKHFADVRIIQLYENFGKGAAVREGVLAARGEYVLIADADGATPISELARLEAAIAAGADVAIGSRYLRDSEIGRKQNLLRRLVSRIGNLLIRSLLDLPYKDTQCGFKLFERRAACYLFRNLSNIRFGFDFEILKKASVLNLNVTEVPVRWNDQAGSKVTLKLSLRVLNELLYFRFAHLIKFAFVGILNTLIDFSIHNILIITFGYGGAIRQLIYMVGAFLSANLLAFCLHSGFTFQKRAAYGRFFAVSAFTLALAALLFHGLNILYNPENSILLTNVFKLSTVLISFITNYFGYRFWVYRYGV